MAKNSKSTSQVQQFIEDNYTLILHGDVLYVDPSVGSSSSQPAVALYSCGKLVESQELTISVGLPLHTRLKTLRYNLEDYLFRHPVDILVYEDIADRRYGPTANASAHASLLKAVGVVMSTDPDLKLGLSPVVWTKLKSSTYKKGDEADAIEMGRVLTLMARYYVAENNLKNRASNYMTKKKSKSGEAKSKSRMKSGRRRKVKS